MYTNVSSAFTTKLAKPSRHFAARFKYNNTVLDFDIKSITMTIGTCGGSSFAVGCAFAGYIEVTMKYTDTLLEGKELALELGLLLDNGNYEYVPFGYWTVQKPTKNNDMMTFQAVDRMASKLSGDYETSLTYPATIANVISELATKTGLTINCSLQTSNTLAVKIDGVTNRGALAIIAATLLGNAWIDRSGNVQITKTTTTTPVVLNYDYVKTQPQTDEEPTVIGGVKVYTVSGSRDTWIERGSGTTVEVSDVYMTSTILDSVKNNVIGLTYNGGEVSFMGNPLLDPSDAVRFNNAYTVPCMEIVHVFDGGLLTTVTAPGKFEATDSTIQVGAITEELSRRAQETASAQATADEALSIATNVSQDFADAVLRIDGDIFDLQNQIDGNITTWFYAVDPTTSNPPASSWTTTDEKNNHLGDLYYNTESGYAWRWMKTNNVFSWGRISDSDIAEALAVAQTAQDTADGKRRVFYTTPTPPYDKGDLWVQGSTGDIKYCNTARSSGSYNSSDWVLASKYTDDTAANAAQLTADSATQTANNAVTLANGKNKTFFQDTAPSSGMVAGDLWFDTDGGNAIYEYKVTNNVGTWTLRQLGQGSIVAGSITGNEIYGNTLSAIFLDAGEITAGILRSSDYSYTSGNTYTTAGMIIDLNNKIIRTPKTAILSDGTIHANNGVFTGEVNSTYGTIGGFTISATSLSATGVSINSYESGGAYIVMSDTNALLNITPYHIGYYSEQVSSTSALADVGCTNGLWGTVRVAEISSTNGNELNYISLGRGSIDVVDLGTSNAYVLVRNSVGTLTMRADSNGNYGLIGTVGSSTEWLLRYDSYNARAEIPHTLKITGDADISGTTRIINGSLGVNKTSGTDGNAGFWANSAGNIYLTGGTNAGSVIYFYYNKATSATSNITETASGRLTASNTFNAATIGSGKKTSYNDGNAGVWLQAGGVIDISNAAGGGIQWHYANSSSVTSNIIETASGVLTTSGSFVATGVGVNKTSGQDGNAGFWANSAGNVFLTGSTSAGSTIYFYFNKATSSTSYISETVSGVLKSSAYFEAKDYSGSIRRVITSYSTDGQRIAGIGCDSTKLYVTGQHGTTGSTYSSKNITFSSSDIRLKKNVKPSTVAALALIDKIKVREFDWTDDREDKHQIIGMIADELEKIDPRFAVGGGFDENGLMSIKSVDTFYLVGYLVKAVQELSAKVKTLEKGA